MRLKLTYPLFLICCILIWFVFLVKAFFLTENVAGRDIFSELIVVAIILQLTVIAFLYNWYRHGIVKLVDYFRLSSFFFLIWNYLSIADKTDKKVGIDGEFYINNNYILPSLITILIGVLALTLIDKVFQVLLNRQQKPFTLFVPQNYTLKNFNIFYIISGLFLLIQVYLLVFGLSGYNAESKETGVYQSSFVQFVSNISALFLTIFCVLKYLYNVSGRVFNLLFVLYILGYIFYGLITGMKGTLIFGAVIFFIPYFLSGRTLSVKWVVLGSFFLIFLYPFNNNYRLILNDYPSFKKSDAIFLAGAMTLSQDFETNFNSSSDSYGYRFSMFPYLVYVEQHESNWNHYKNMQRYAYLPFFFIPRSILPSKPVQDNGDKLHQMILKHGKNSITPTSYGWAYLEGNNFYVFFSFVLLGIVISIFQYVVDKKNIFYLLFYIFLVIQLMIVENEIFFLLSSIFQNIIFYYLFSKLLFKKNIQKRL